MNRKTMKIGLFGFGCVGKGLYDVLQQTSGISAEIVKICVKDRTKVRALPDSFFTFEKEDILDDPEIDVVVELINDAADAFGIITNALHRGKAVVTANKKMLAEHFRELYGLQQTTGMPLLYEGAVCAAIPVIRTLEEYYDNDLLSSVEGIFNGTTNYMLTKMNEEKIGYHEALKMAREKGFAESNPRLDVEAYDPKYKLVIIAAHAFGLFVEPDHVLNIGICNLTADDVLYANEKGYRIKLVPHLQKSGNLVSGYVMPQFVAPDDPLYTISNEFNAVGVKAAFADRQFFSGRGAGSIPTGAAVLSDISALTYQYRYAYKKTVLSDVLQFNNDHWIKAYIRYTDKEVLEELGVMNMEESYQSKKHKYVIGEVSIQALITAGINERKDVFVIKAGETSGNIVPDVGVLTEALGAIEFA